MNWVFITLCSIIVIGAIACGWHRAVKVVINNRATAKAPTAHYNRGPDGRFN